MGRLVRLAIYAVVIYVLYFWISAVIKSYKKADVPETEQGINIDSTSADTLQKNITADSLIDDTGDKLISNEDIVDGAINYNEVDTKVKELEEKKEKVKPTVNTTSAKTSKSDVKPESKPAIKPVKEVPQKVKNIETKPKTKPQTKEVITGEGGNFMVMCGSYLLKVNADKMVKKLKNIGYSNAEVVVFPLSEYHSVVAARFATDEKALKASAELKRKGIESYIKQK